MKKVVKQFLATMLVLISVICLWQPAEVQAASKKEPVLSSTSVVVEGTGDWLGKNWIKLKVFNANAKVEWEGDKNIHLQASDGAVATFWPTKAGKGTITCKVGKKTLTCKVTVLKSDDLQEPKYSIKTKKIGKDMMKATITNKSKVVISGDASLELFDDEWKYVSTVHSNTVTILPGKKKTVYISGIEGYNYDKAEANMEVNYRKDLIVNENKIQIDESNIKVEPGYHWIYGDYNAINVKLKNKSNRPIIVEWYIKAYKNDKLYAIGADASIELDAKATASVEYRASGKNAFSTVSGKEFNGDGVTYKVEIKYIGLDEKNF